MKSINVCLEIPFSKKSCHIETSTPICFTIQLTGFYTIQVLTERYFRTDFRLLLTVISCPQMTYKSNYNEFYKSK